MIALFTVNPRILLIMLLLPIHESWKLGRAGSLPRLSIFYASLGISTMVSGIIKLLMSFLGIVMTGIGNMFSTIFAGMGNSVVIMLQSFGFSAASYGIFGPIAFVIGLGGAILIGYLFLVPTRAEEDVVQDEDDV